jgi:hypothetical protein
MAGHVAAARNLVGRDPLTAEQLELGALNSPRYDLSAVWRGPPYGPPRAVAPQRHAAPPTLQAFRDAPDVEALTRLLEGSSVMQLPTLPPLEAGEDGSEEGLPPRAARPRWLVPVALAVAVIGAVTVALLAT